MYPQINAYIEDENGCWIWQRTKNIQGYGRVSRNGTTLGAHRWYWERENGPVPDGLELDHLCRVKACVNPEHMEPVTHSENLRRHYVAEPRPVKTHCKRGHEFNPENTYRTPGGWRVCRACRKVRSRDHYWKEKALKEGVVSEAEQRGLDICRDLAEAQTSIKRGDFDSASALIHQALERFANLGHQARKERAHGPS